MKQVNNLWYQIFQIVKENCLVEFCGSDAAGMTWSVCSCPGKRERR